MAGFIAISSEGFTVKLEPITQDEGVRNPKPSYNVFSHKLFCIQISNIG